MRERKWSKPERDWRPLKWLRRQRAVRKKRREGGERGRRESNTFLFAPVLTMCSKASDNHSGRRHNAGGKRLFLVGGVE